MGNGQTREEIERSNYITNEIMNYDCCLLDIGNKVGETFYIDFITENMLEGHDVMKGVDIHGRSFIVVKAHVIYKGLFIDNTFTTFFQRYRGEHLWMGCSQKGNHFMETEGGMTIAQLELLRDLLYKRRVTIDNSNTRCIYIDDSHKDDIILIQLGHKIDCFYIKQEPCINNPIATMDIRSIMKELLCDVPEDIREYILEEFDDKVQEIKGLKTDLEIANEELERIRAEMSRLKNDMNQNALPKPLLERQTNDYCTPTTYPKGSLWAETVLEDIEMENMFDNLSVP
jgi:hypothetical protein